MTIKEIIKSNTEIRSAFNEIIELELEREATLYAVQCRTEFNPEIFEDLNQDYFDSSLNEKIISFILLTEEYGVGIDYDSNLKKLINKKEII